MCGKSRTASSHEVANGFATVTGKGTTIITAITATPLNPAIYKNLNVSIGTTYYYVVTAVNAYSKESPYSNEATATPAELKVSATITSPYDGEKTSSSRVLIKGTVESASKEVGVVVEATGTYGTARYLAQVNGQNFAATVDLQEGANTIKVIAMEPSGNKAEATVTVNASMIQETIRLTATPESGIMTLKTITSPYPPKEGYPMPQTYALDVTLRVEAYLPNPIASYSWDFNGDGWPEQTGSLPEVTATYYSTGLYFPTVTVTDTKGITYTATTIVNVLDRNEIDSILKGKWEGMKGALVQGDTETALNYFSEDSRQLYNRRFP